MADGKAAVVLAGGARDVVVLYSCEDEPSVGNTASDVNELIVVGEDAIIPLEVVSIRVDQKILEGGLSSVNELLLGVQLSVAASVVASATAAA